MAKPPFKGTTMSHAPSTFRQNDIARAFRAARAAGITARIDIAKDGTIRIYQLPQEAVEGPKPSPETNEWDRALGKSPA
jgi:hypothetical protein